MGTKLLKNEKGFSLLETTLSTCVMATGLMAGFLMMQTATVASVEGDYRVIAMQLANEKLETILADKSMNTGKYEYIIDDNYPEEAVAYLSDDGMFTRSTAITEVNNDDLSTPQNDSGYKKVDVTVTWDTPVGGTQQVMVSTLLTDY